MLNPLRMSLVLAAAMGLFCATQAVGDESQSDKELVACANASKIPIWIVSFGDKKACVRLSTITSASLHAYMLDGSIKVSELTIDTQGNNSLRIYCVSSEKANDIKGRLNNVRNLIDKRTENASHLPSRKFPEGAYSHNVEYQVESPEILNKAYDSLLKAWLNNKSAALSLGDSAS